MMQQHKIIYTLGVRPVIDPSIEIRIIINFLKSYLKKYDCLRSYIVGISGGQDSTLTGKLCQLAINELKKETGSLVYKFIAVRLPYGYQEDEQDCLDAISFIQPDEILTVNIKDAVLTSINSLLNVGIEMNDFVKGNQKARERMKILYSISNINSGLVVGTTNAAEFLTGFFTKYGDHGTDINPILRLNKRQGRLLLKYLNCPSNLYFKIPTADLEDNRPLLSDEIILGITYDTIDDYLEGKVIDKKEIITIENLYNQNQHKRCLPIRLFG